MSIKTITALILPAILFISFCISPMNAAVSLNWTQGNLSDFNDGGRYLLTCQLEPLNLLDSYQNYSSGFYYYTNDQDDMVLIQKGNGFFDISYYLHDYNSGTYYCEIIIRDVDTHQLSTFSHTFRIDSSLSPVELGDTCKANQDCMTLNAVCVKEECKCEGDYFIKYNHHDDTPACFRGMSDLNKRCVIDNQCQMSDSRYTCQGGYCLKTSHGRMTPFEIGATTLGTLVVCLLIVIAGRLATKK